MKRCRLMASAARHGCLAVLRVDGIGDQPVLGALNLVRGDALGDDVVDHGVDCIFELGQCHAGLRRAVDAELRGVERSAVVRAAGADREFAFDHERAVEPAGGAVPENE